MNFMVIFKKGKKLLIKVYAVSASLYMSVPFNTFLTNEYMEKFSDPQVTEYVKILCNDLKVVFRKILMRNNWIESKN